MFCAKCGAANSDNNYRCTQCGEELLRAGEHGGFVGGGSPPPSGLATAIIVTILCCWPLGIPAIVFAAQTIGHNSAGRFEQAQETARKSKMWSWISFGVGLVVFAVYMVFFTVGGVPATP